MSHKFYFLTMLLFFCMPAFVFAAAPPREAPTEVISDVTYMKKGGVQGIQVDFALPVHYVSHFPAKHGNTLTINLRFSQQEVPDVSQLPLLQSMTPPRSNAIPVTEVTYLTDKDRPQLIVKFSRDVKFSVSQIKGITSLVIFLPGTFKAKSTGKGSVALPSIIDSASKGDSSGNREDKLYRRGRKALQSGDNRTAIQVFTALLSLDTHKHSKESLELLGVARERNGQQAHAKAAYSEYMEKYKEGKDTDRVKQRLAELLVNRNKPKKRLKNSKKSDKKDNYRSDLFVSVSQFIDTVDSKQEFAGEREHDITQTSLDNQLSLNWRIRDGKYDIRNFFYGNYEYDTIDGDTDGFEINSMYTRFKNAQDGIYFTVGRQSATSTGVLSKYDGLLVGYDIGKNTRFNVVGGFPVLTTEKRTIQTDKPFQSVNLEFNDLWKSLDVSPFYYQQQVEGADNRQAVGAELRYFHNRGDFFALYDRDIMFDATNIILLRGKYLVQKRTSININYDKRRSPSLEMESVLRGLDPQIENIQDIYDLPGLDYTEEELRAIADSRTGESKLVTIGISHSFSNALHLTLDRTSSDYVSQTASVLGSDNLVDDTQAKLDAIPERLETKSNDFSIQLVTSQSFYLRDSTIIYFRAARANNSIDNTLSFEYRWPYTNNLRINMRMQLKAREAYKNGNDGLPGRDVTITDRIIPSIKFNYRARKNLRFFSELTFEYTDIDTGVENTSGTVQDTSLYIGYTWDLL